MGLAGSRGWGGSEGEQSGGIQRKRWWPDNVSERLRDLTKSRGVDGGAYLQRDGLIENSLAPTASHQKRFLFFFFKTGVRP